MFTRAHARDLRVRFCVHARAGGYGGDWVRMCVPANSFTYLAREQAHCQQCEHIAERWHLRVLPLQAEVAGAALGHDGAQGSAQQRLQCHHEHGHLGQETHALHLHQTNNVNMMTISKLFTENERKQGTWYRV